MSPELKSTPRPQINEIGTQKLQAHHTHSRRST